ncbi:Sugar phosphate permease [Variovorax sp. HW608]|jgi:MFS family permease|uniref:MFS transporter n=1 Tax=Variovorax sp. HW608 TaxID=1034889 RepID=UPI00081FECAD|nr:MFS transporter [Variovorax sp. HW608]SCK37518.1 Sugar phosphate permease [Variovorax sp. HW608]
MDLHTQDARPHPDKYLYGPRQAWFAFAMTIGLMVFDYIDRQVIVSMFPHMKLAWGLSDKQLGSLVSVVSITVALGALPVALIADRTSRVRSIVVMATAWSLASISCMFTRNFGQLFAARAVVGLGEAGYGSVGGALIASHFPSRLRGMLMAGFFACASVGSVLGVMLGGVIAARWGWQAAFGVVGIPGLVLALLYLTVRDYRTVALTPRLDAATRSTGTAARAIARGLLRSRTMLWICIGGSMQLIVVSTVWSWLPSFLNRVHGMAADQAGVKAALVVLCGAVGSVVWGAVVDRAGARRPRAKLMLMALLCLSSLIVLATAFGEAQLQLGLSRQSQFALIAFGGFLMTCTVGPVAAVAIDVIHPGVRATGASVLALCQNLFGLAAGPFITGVLSDHWGLETALTAMPTFAVVAAVAFMAASRSYEADAKRAGEPLGDGGPVFPPAPRKALA